MVEPVRSYRTEQEWRWDWKLDWEGDGSHRWRRDRKTFPEIAHFLAEALASDGFKLFENGGSPLFLRYYEDLREEIVLIPAPKMTAREDLPFTAKVYVSSPLLSELRSRYWKPAIRAPHSVAAGNIGVLEPEPVYHIFSGAGKLTCASALCRLISLNVLPWLDVFHFPAVLRSRIYEGRLPLIDESTSLELLLLYFDSFEARRYLRYREKNVAVPGQSIDLIGGYDMQSSRLDPIRAYYRLETW